MQVKELIDFLSKCDPEMKVLMSSDSEGNAYHEMHEGEVRYFTSSDGYSYDTFGEEDLEEMKRDFGIETPPKAVVFWP